MASISIEYFFGPFFIMICFVFMLYGIFCTQVYYYFTVYRDRLALKLLVYLLCILETVHAACCMHMLYTYLVLYVTEPEKVLKVIWSASAITLLEHTIGVTVQSYYIYRLWQLSRNMPIIIAVISLEATRVAIGYRSVAYLVKDHTWADFVIEKDFGLYANLTYSLNIFVDSTIAFCLVYYFRTKSRTSAHTRSTKRILLKLTHFAFTAGALTVLASVAVLIAYNTSKASITFGGALQIVAKLYAISMLGMLNARNSIMSQAVPQNGMSLQLSTFPHSGNPRSPTRIHVLKETHTTPDNWSSEYSPNEPTDSSLPDIPDKVHAV